MRILAVLSILFASVGQTQTITTLPIYSNALCPGDSATIRYTTTGAIDKNGRFSVQLSNANGSFTDFTTLSPASDTNSGFVTIFVPRELEGSNNYRVRVVTNSPYTIGKDNGSDLSVRAIDNYHLGLSPYIVLPGQHVSHQLLRSHHPDADSGSSFLWRYDSSASTLTATGNPPPLMSYATPGHKTFSLTVTRPNGCAMPLRGGGPYVTDCHPRIPSDAWVHDVDGIYGGPGKSTWVKAGVRYEGHTDTLFADPGAIIGEKAKISMLAFLAAGAELHPYASTGYVVYTNGASIDESDEWRVKCDSLAFDYSTIPIKKPLSVARNVTILQPLQKGSSFTIEDKLIEVLSIEVFDMLGRLVATRRNSNTIDLLGNARGKYILRFVTPTKVFSKIVLY